MRWIIGALMAVVVGVVIAVVVGTRPKDEQVDSGKKLWRTGLKFCQNFRGDSGIAATRFLDGASLTGHVRHAKALRCAKMQVVIAVRLRLREMDSKRRGPKPFWSQ